MTREIAEVKSMVFINQSSGYLMVDIVNGFAEKGYQCALIAGSVTIRKDLLANRVIKHKIIKYNRDSSIKRLFTWIFGTFQIWFLIVLRYRRSHLFIVSNPPFSILLPLFVKNSFSLLIYDVFPDSITELGILSERSRLIRQWKKYNRKVFKKAKNIFTITEGMKERLDIYAEGKEIHVIPLWTDNEFLKPVIQDENIFLLEQNLKDNFVVLYSGNIGIANDLSVLANIARHEKMQNIEFVIIGDGAGKRKLEVKLRNEQIDNVRILPWQKTDRLRFTLSAADLAVVILGEGQSKLAIPSKIYSLLSVGAPVLGIAGKDSDLWKFIENNKIGRCFIHEQTNEIISYIESLSGNFEQCMKLRNNALMLSKKYSRANVELYIQAETQI